MSVTHRILLVVNPISGGLEKADLVDHLKYRLGDHGFEVYYTTGKNDKEDIRDLIHHNRPDRILIAGGDGTIKLIAEIIQDDPIPLGIFPAGSANGLAANLNLPSDIEDIASIALGDNLTSLDCIMINGEFCLHISDIGLNAELIRNYEEGNIRGKLGYVIQSIPTLIQSDFPFDFSIEINGNTLHRKAVLVGIANAKKYGTGATINPRGLYDDGKFEILIFKQFNIPEILKTFQENVELSRDFLEIIPASKARITCERKVPFQIDGEYRGEITEIHAEISSVKLQIAVPKVQDQTASAPH